MSWNGGFLIPVYNHGKTTLSLCKRLLAFSLPIIVVDDCSNEETKNYLQETAVLSPLVHLVTKKQNSGKGGAVITGFRVAHQLRLDAVFQIDADGQHDDTQAVTFIKASEEHPGVAICGRPVFDASVPASRLKGREIGNNYLRFVTLNPHIVDAMCGFRIYPVEKVYQITRYGLWDKRMGFDIEILARLYWKGCTHLLFYPVKVIYSEGGSSNFHMVRDNIRISWVFTCLTVGMIVRLPWLLAWRRHGN